MFWAKPEITTNIAAPEHFGHFLTRIYAKIVKKCQAGMSEIWGGANFRECFPPEATLPGSTRVFEPWPKLPQTLRPRNMLGHFGTKNDQKKVQNRPGRHAKIWGCAFLGRKNRRRPPCPEAQGFFAPSWAGFWHVQIWGCAFLGRKTAGGHLARKHKGFCTQPTGPDRPKRGFGLDPASHGDWEARRRRERRPKADLMRVDALGAFRRPGHRPAGGRRPT